MTPRPAWEHAERVLCVRLDNLGDVLMTTPALRALCERHPRRRLTLLGSASGVAALRHVPELDDAIEYAAPWMKSAAAPDPASDGALVRRLAERRFDAAVIFTVYSQSPLPAALLCHLAGIPLRLAHCRENPYGLLTDWLPERDPQEPVRHEVQRQLDLVAAVGCSTDEHHLSFRVDAQDRARCERELRARGLVGRRLIVVHPGASAPSRRYPPAQFARALELLAAELPQAALVLTGSPEEQALVDEIAARCAAPTVSLAGALELGAFGALLERAALLLANNTGPVHIAAALGTPVVDLYALTNPQHTPWMVPSRVLYHDVPCKYCYKSVCPQGHQDCLRLVAPETVALAATALYARPARRRVSPAAAATLSLPA